MSFYKFDGTLMPQSAAPTADYSSSTSMILTGTAGADQFSLLAGNVGTGLGGDDTYYLKGGTTVNEAVGGGIDTIIGWQNINLALSPNVENAQVSNDGLYAAGNDLDNLLIGGAGAQTLDGGAGQDVLVGGAGADVFVIVKGQGNDVIQDFTAADGDTVRLTSPYTTFDQVQAHMTQVGADVKLDLGGGDAVLFRNTTVSGFTAKNFVLPSNPAGTAGAMTFDEEFNGTSLSARHTWGGTGTWDTDYGYQGKSGLGSYSLTGNGELQLYASSDFQGSTDHVLGVNPFDVSNGVLTISATKLDAATSAAAWNYQYVSGMISTKDSFSQTYGYFEMRADLPDAAAKGAWPAFWLVPADGSWPPELDVMETLSRDPNTNYTTAHTGAANNSSSAASYVTDTGGFHTYGVMWSPTTLTFYEDGVQLFQTATPADMNKPMYMIANLALGGWGGAVDDAGLSSAQMKIDYIRAYALGDPNTPVVVTPPVVTPPVVDTPPPVVTPPVVVTPPPPAHVDPTITLSGGGIHAEGSTGTTAFTFLVTRTGDLSQTSMVDWWEGAPSGSGYATADDFTGKTAGTVYFAAGEASQTITIQVLGDTKIESDETFNVDLSNARGAVLSTAQATGCILNDDFSHTGWVYTGTGKSEWVTGSSYNDTVSGGGGNDSINGYAGDDRLTGGAGKDTFYFDVGSGHDTITDFTHKTDKLAFSGHGSDHGTWTETGADATLTFKNGDSVTLTGVDYHKLTSADWIFT